MITTSMSRFDSVSRHYFSKSRSHLGLEGLKSWSPSRLGTLKSPKMGMSRPIFYFCYGTILASKYAERILFQSCLIMYNHWF